MLYIYIYLPIILVSENLETVAIYGKGSKLRKLQWMKYPKKSVAGQNSAHKIFSLTKNDLCYPISFQQSRYAKISHWAWYCPAHWTALFHNHSRAVHSSLMLHWPSSVGAFFEGLGNYCRFGASKPEAKSNKPRLPTRWRKCKIASNTTTSFIIKTNPEIVL